MTADEELAGEAASRESKALAGAEAARRTEEERLPFPLHAGRTVPVGLDPSTVLYRMAAARARTADIRRRQYEETGNPGRRQREIDLCVETVVLTQGALEAWINWAHLTSGVKPKGTWIERWTKGLHRIAEARGHTPSFALSDEHRRFLQELGSWRNFLLHGDASSRVRLLERTGGVELSDLLTADYAAEVIRGADSVFTLGGAVTGIVAPYSVLLSVASDELI